MVNMEVEHLGTSASGVVASRERDRDGGRGCWLIAAATAWLLSGCALFLPRFEPPKLSVVSVQVGKTELWEQQLKVRMRVQNPNDRSLPIKGLAYVLEVDGEQFAHGISGASFVVPANGEAEFDTDVTANLAGTLMRLVRRGGGGTVPYRLTGKVSLSAGMLRSIPFDEQGSFKFP